jgi:hypothetical protein
LGGYDDYYKYENNSNASMIIYEKKIINNERGLIDNIKDKKNDFSSYNKSFITGLEISKEFDKNYNLNPDSKENTEEEDSFDDYSVNCNMENFVNKFNKIKLDAYKKCSNMLNDTNNIFDELLKFNYKPKKRKSEYSADSNKIGKSKGKKKKKKKKKKLSFILKIK